MFFFSNNMNFLLQHIFYTEFFLQNYDFLRYFGQITNVVRLGMSSKWQHSLYAS